MTPAPPAPASPAPAPVPAAPALVVAGAVMLGSSAVLVALSQANASTAAFHRCFLAALVLVALTGGAVLLGESLSWVQVGGIALVIGGVLALELGARPA